VYTDGRAVGSLLEGTEDGLNDIVGAVLDTVLGTEEVRYCGSFSRCVIRYIE
jgi:hypothetical protein